MSDVHLRGFAPSDAAPAAELAARLFARPWSAAQYADEAASPDRDYLVAEHDGVLVGFAGAWDAPDVTHVMTVAVAGDARRQGIGRRLVTALVERATHRGARAWTLEVRDDAHGARALYDSLGFVEVGRRPEYYDDVARRVDAVLMTRTATG